MAAFNRLKEATYEVHESVKVDTQGKFAYSVGVALDVYSGRNSQLSLY